MRKNMNIILAVTIAIAYSCSAVIAVSPAKLNNTLNPLTRIFDNHGGLIDGNINESSIPEENENTFYGENEPIGSKLKRQNGQIGENDLPDEEFLNNSKKCADRETVVSSSVGLSRHSTKVKPGRSPLQQVIAVDFSPETQSKESTEKKSIPKVSEAKSAGFFMSFFSNISFAAAAHSASMTGSFPVYINGHNIDGTLLDGTLKKPLLVPEGYSPVFKYVAELYNGFSFADLAGKFKTSVRNFFKELDDLLDKEGNPALYADLYNYTL